VGVAQIAGYTVTRELGQGGMGKVFQALSPQGGTVAIKTMLLSPGVDARTRWETVERFQREARAARSLMHPNIVQVLDIGADQDTFFIVMEFLDGQTVRELIELAGAIRLERAVQIMAASCEALAYAHDQGIVHRDIKPDNIMLLRNGTVKLTDFGLAAIVAEKGVTHTGTVMGTFAYMSPEQARGEKLDARSDIFSLGSTFYEMLTGRPPFPGTTPAAVLSGILNTEPQPIQGLPASISRTVTKCLRKQPHYRFQNAREIIAGLRNGDTSAAAAGTAILPGRPVTPPPAVAPPRDSGVPASTGGAIVSRPAVETPLAGFRCSKCGERMNRSVATCWKCGAPNSLMVQRTQQAKRQQEINQALSGLEDPTKKGGRSRPR
jgi:serine/threonine-protein kinase